MTVRLKLGSIADTQRRVTATLIREREPHFAGALTLDQVFSRVRDAVADHSTSEPGSTTWPRD